MKKILYDLLEKDKVKHFLLGTIIYLSLARFVDVLPSLITVIFIGLCVELYDKISGKGKFEMLDALATFLLPLILFTLEKIYKLI